MEQTLGQFMQQQAPKLWQQTLTHTGLTCMSLLLSVLVALPLGIFIARKPKAAGVVLGIAGILQTIPSIALLGFLIPLLGIGAIPAITALFLYALLPVIRNTFTGITGVDPAITESARGLGMNSWQVLTQVEIPLALPVILAGIRTAAVINVGVATLAAYIAAGGLGEFIFGGISLNNTHMILAGAIPAALLALAFDVVLSFVQKLSSRRLRKAVWIIPAILLLSSSAYVIPSSQQKMLAGFTPEFMGREDGYLGLTSVYKLDIPTVVISDAVMYKAAFEQKIDVISGYSTDGRLKAYDLVTLTDDKGIFPPYYAAPVVRVEVLKTYPEVEPTLNLLAGKINDSVMTELNYRVDYRKQLPEQVAREFLQSQGLLKNQETSREGKIRLGSKIFGEQYILVHMYKLLLEGYTPLSVELKTGLGGTKICFDALTHGEIDLYPEYTGTGLLTILKASTAQQKQLGPNRDRVYAFVQKEFQKKYQLQWLSPIGFNNAYALMMRRSQAQAFGIHTISDLSTYVSNHHLQP
ncbi:glycine betaine ABC transporter substrate-binding protein [Siphonobacter sp. SORGH_AS_0500]|uniref:ABC transporter permease/substrate-binding protein n=1 Tax=Siphonobacter sp. SORGH_AS_0500 TaxID=1864824 RepID=UPI00285D0139|nr:glycine betaine ABC transporter substrate-binding protein [Siphonobacter sp. SORGH_AS_0500]MDR6198003.1 osmoprotectant transport system permease protein [Siphonobacter sp. SORGH_AS_0500]